MKLEETIEQPYQNCRVSAGVVHDNESVPDDTVYLKLERDGEEPTIYTMRPDEAMAVIYCLSGALWSNELRRIDDDSMDVNLPIPNEA